MNVGNETAMAREIGFTSAEFDELKEFQKKGMGEKEWFQHVMWHRLAKLPGSICRFCKIYHGGSPKCEHHDCGGWGWWEWNGQMENGR